MLVVVVDPVVYTFALVVAEVHSRPFVGPFAVVASFVVVVVVVVVEDLVVAEVASYGLDLVAASLVAFLN